MTERERGIMALRQIADFLGTHPELPFPYIGTMCLRVEPKQIRTVAKALRVFKKNYGINDFEMHREFGPISLMYYTSREAVCKKVVVGVEEIPEMIVPAKPEQFIPASEERVIPAHTKERVEWVCSDAALTSDEPLPVVEETHQAEEMPF